MATSAIVFCLFSFLFIYCYQTPTLAYEQHVLSGGVTVYHPLVSAILITIVGLLLQWLVFGVVRLRGASHALTYLPSMLLLASITSAYPDGEGGLTVGLWLWFIPLILIAYACLIKVVKQWISSPVIPGEGIFSSHTLLVNMLTMVLMMLFVLKASNGDELFHRQVRAEKLLLENRYAELAKEGQGRSLLAQRTGITVMDGLFNSTSERTDSTLTLLRFLAMDHQHNLADSVFMQPVAGSTASLLRMENIRPLLCTKRFLMRRHSFDYKMCALLAERDLDRFARMLSERVDLSDSTVCDSLPRHYKEALILYQHLRSNPITNYVNPVLETDYRDMKDMQHECANIDERKHALQQNYRNSYWKYYGLLYLAQAE